jgi:hypothetical protein
MGILIVILAVEWSFERERLRASARQQRAAVVAQITSDAATPRTVSRS